MHKQFLIAIAAVCVIALGAVGVVVFQQNSNDETVTDTDILPPAEQADRSESRRPGRRRPERSSRELIQPPAPPIDVPQATVSPSPDGGSRGGGVAAGYPQNEAENDELRQRVSAMVDQLSDEERRAMSSELRRRQMEAFRQATRTGLSSDMQLLAISRRPGMELSAEQQARIEELRNNMQPKVEAALAGIRSQREQIESQMRSMGEQGLDTSQLRTQWRELRQRENEISQQLDVEYKASLSTVLSAEQLEAMNSMPTWGGRRTGGGRGR